MNKRAAILILPLIILFSITAAASADGTPWKNNQFVSVMAGGGLISPPGNEQMYGPVQFQPMAGLNLDFGRLVNTGPLSRLKLFMAMSFFQKEVEKEFWLFSGGNPGSGGYLYKDRMKLRKIFMDMALGYRFRFKKLNYYLAPGITWLYIKEWAFGKDYSVKRIMPNISLMIEWKITRSLSLLIKGRYNFSSYGGPACSIAVEQKLNLFKHRFED